MAAVSSELYGYYEGQLNMRKQGPAVMEAVAAWSSDPTKTELDFPVCKSGYRPFDPMSGKRLYGCSRHHKLRRQRLKQSCTPPRG